MTIETNERVAAVATVVTDGNLEILEREPFTARLAGAGVPIMLRTFVFEPAEITVVDLFVPVARVSASAQLDHWIARVSPKLFNVHVAVREVDAATFVEVRSSLVADGLSVEVFDRTLALVAVGANVVVAEELHELLASPSVRSERGLMPALREPEPVAVPAGAGRAATAAAVTFPGYL